MRLLHVVSRKLEEFNAEDIPPYAILSHTWGAEEVTFEDLRTEGHRQKRGYTKIDSCCLEAAQQGISWIWIDTCCIDKSSSAELSEAINSMYNWYEKCKVCFVYMEDVPTAQDPYRPGSAFSKSRWWTRGWTLQEFLAPYHVVMFDEAWNHIFTSEAARFSELRSWKLALLCDGHTLESQHEVIQRIRYQLLAKISGIPEVVLRKEVGIFQVAAACKFSWAARRVTTRVEDSAYSLLGLMGVNMPLLYGEGKKAFVRLQQAILSTSDDISMLAWGMGLSCETIQELDNGATLATTPKAFSEYPQGNTHHFRRSPKIPATITGHGLHVELPLILVHGKLNVWLAIIEEYMPGESGNSGGIAIVLRQPGRDSQILERARGCPPFRVTSPYSHAQRLLTCRRKAIYLQDNHDKASYARTMNLDLERASSLRSFLFKRPIREAGEVTELELSISGLYGAGYTLLSQFPPIDPALPNYGWSNSNWVHVNGKLEWKHRRYGSLLCRGPNEHFYFILVNSRGHRVAIWANVRQKSSYIRSFQVKMTACASATSATAIEHVLKTGIGFKHKTKHSEMPVWKEYVNVWNTRDSQIHFRAVPAQRILSTSSRHAWCDLAWSGGWVEH